MKKILSLFAILSVVHVFGQKLYSDLSTGLNSMSTLGIVEPKESSSNVHSIYTMHVFNHYSLNTDDLQYQLSEVIIEDDVTIGNTYNLDDILQPNEHILQQIVKDGKWYVLGYEKRSDSVKQYFIKELQVENGIVEFITNGIYTEIDTTKGKSVITKARILDDHRIAFCGSKRNTTEEESYSLFIIYDELAESLFEVTTPRTSETSGVKFFQDAFIANDTLYAHYALAQKRLLVFDDDYKYLEFRSLSESVTKPGNSDYSFGTSINYSRWGKDHVISGRTFTDFNRKFDDDFYLQLYDSSFTLIYDERYYLEDIETVPYYNSFVPLNDNYGIMISSLSLGNFGFNFPHDLNLRLINKTTRETSLFRLEEEDFTHFDDGYAVDNKLLLAGYTTKDPETGSANILYYLVDYTDLITGINEETKTHIAKIKIYPNPIRSGELLNLSWSGMQKQSWQVKLYDNQGRIVHETSLQQGVSETTILLPELPSGTYIVRVEGSGKQVHTGTLVVE